jgi:hypothetical protein
MPDGISTTKHLEERRSENRTTLAELYSVEIDLGRPLPIYQLKLRDISGHGRCILVQEGSSILKHLEVGQVLKMKYWTESRSESGGFFKAKVKHISKQDKGRFKGHVLIGLFIKQKHDFDPDKPVFAVTEANRGTKGHVDRRQSIDRRKLTKSGYVEERRLGQDRRSGLDRRSGVDRRSSADRRSNRNL